MLGALVRTINARICHVKRFTRVRVRVRVRVCVSLVNGPMHRWKQGNI